MSQPTLDARKVLELAKNGTISLLLSNSKEVLVAFEAIKALCLEVLPPEAKPNDHEYDGVHPEEETLEVLEAKLTPHQARALVKLKAWHALPWTPDNFHFILQGFSGTGKSFLMKVFYKWIGTLNGEDPYTTVHWCAPTHKAAKVLSNFVDTEAGTLHSLLCLRPDHSEEEVATFKPDPYAKSVIVPRSILGVDEGSMVGTELIGHVISSATRNRCKVLWIGDPAQLPPVGEETSPAFALTQNKAYRTYLQEVVRYDGGLLDLATAIRTAVMDEDFQFKPTTAFSHPPAVTFVEGDDFLDEILRRAKKGPQVFEETKVLAWRNKTVNEYNARIREVIGYDQPYVAGEMLLTSGAYSLQDPAETTEPIIVNSETEFRVESVQEGEVHIPLGTSGEVIDVSVYYLEVCEPFLWRLQVAQEPSHLDYLKTRLADYAKQLARIEKTKSRPALEAMKVAVIGKTGRTSRILPSALAWRNYWMWIGQFHAVRYPYALTVHRSQGSTYDHVMVDQRDILYNRNADEALRCLYVANTRARHSTFIRHA